MDPAALLKDMAKAEDAYERQAQEAERLAENAPTTAQRAKLLKVAKGWRDLLANLQARKKQFSPIRQSPVEHSPA